MTQPVTVSFDVNVLVGLINGLAVADRSLESTGQMVVEFEASQPALRGFHSGLRAVKTFRAELYEALMGSGLHTDAAIDLE